MQLPIVSKLSRRDLLTKSSKLSLVSFALLSGLNTKVMAQESPSVSPQDIDVLNEILGTEHEGIAAYQICVDGGFLRKSAIKTALLFQNHHKKHRDILIDKINSLGGTSVIAKEEDDYKSDLNVASLKSQNDALHMMVKLERGAANAYIGMLPSTNDHALATVAGRIAADEVIHWTTLSALLQIPLPTQALSFGT